MFDSHLKKKCFKFSQVSHMSFDRQRKSATCGAVMLIAYQLSLLSMQLIDAIRKTSTYQR